jgi:hypothetical protein
VSRGGDGQKLCEPFEDSEEGGVEPGHRGRSLLEGFRGGS